MLWLSTTTLSGITWFLVRHIRSLPFLNRLRHLYSVYDLGSNGLSIAPYLKHRAIRGTMSAGCSSDGAVHQVWSTLRVAVNDLEDRVRYPPVRPTNKKEGEPMPARAVDLDRLATYLTNKMESEGLSVRAAAKAIDVGASTLARLLQGNANENVPDLAVVNKAAQWVGKTLADLAPSQKESASTIADVEVHLRGLPDLAPPDVEALVAMVKAGYERAKKLRTEKSPQRPGTPTSQS